MYVYFPSCNFTMSSPEGTKKVKEYMREKYDARIEGCCRPGQKKLSDEDIAITICQSCSIITKENHPNTKELSIFEILDADDSFNWPDLKGERITIQDCWRAKNNRPLQNAVRSIMKKMNIEIVELEENFDKTEFCGVFRFNEMVEKNKKIAPKYFIDYMKDNIELHDEKEQQRLMEEHNKLYTTDRVICYCNACLRGVIQGGGNGVHLMDLIMGIVK